MAKAFPYFRWYPADAETDEFYSSLTDAELGFYHRLLNRSWINWGLPADMDELARAMRVTRAYLDKMWQRLGQRFTLTDAVHPRYINSRQEEEREHAITKSQKSSSAVRTRYGRSTDELPRARARADSDSVYESSFISQKNKKEEVREFPNQSRFHEWLDGYQGRKADPDAACRAWISVDGDSNAETAFACRDRYNASREVADGAVMEASNFIFQQGRNGWRGDWPRSREAPQRGYTRQSTAEAMLDRAEELMRDA